MESVKSILFALVATFKSASIMKGLIALNPLGITTNS